MTKRPSWTDIGNAFQPSKEIDAADRFAGRRDAVANVYYALISPGTNIAIVGNRGIGKTSLARQIEKIASGDNTLLQRLKIRHDKKLDYLTIYFACGNMISDINDLLQRLLTINGGLADWIYDIPKGRKTIETSSPELTAQIVGIGAKYSLQKGIETDVEPAIGSHPIDAVFTNVCADIVNENVAPDGLLIIIDEFDQIRDPTGMAGLMKSIATNVPNVKFCIVGVGQDIHKLMKEHESSDRLFAGGIINLPPMSRDELSEIVRIAEASLYNYITFTNEATEELVRLAQGHPYMVHLVGRHTLQTAYSNDRRKIELIDVQNALKSIAEQGADPVLEGRYKKAVGSSAQREIVLKAMATVRSEDGELFTTDAYKLALDEGVENASHYVGQLVTDEYGSELEKVRERYYRFKDSLFAAYVLARPRLISK